MQQRLVRPDGTVMSLAQSKRASQVQRDLEAWEHSRMVAAGLAQRSDVGAEAEEDTRWEGEQGCEEQEV